MSIKTILVHLDDSDSSSARADCAGRLALDVKARLIGMYLVPTRELSPSVAAVLPPDVAEAYLHRSGEFQDDAERRFRDVCSSLRLPSSNWMAPAGDPLDAALAHGRCADLVVLGQRDPEDARQMMADELIVTTLLGLGRPVLVLPYIGVRTPPGRRILVAFDGGREAARAVADAMPLLENASDVQVLIGTRDQRATQGYALAAERLDGWLRDHGVRARMEEYDAEPGEAGQLLLSRAADLGTDLIVMGGYAHSRLRQAVLGGVTRTMLASMTVPVLMSH